MIKGITLSRCISNREDIERLSSFLEMLGLESAKSRNDASESGHRFVAPLGSLEFFRAAANADENQLRYAARVCEEIHIEVTSLDSIREATKSWFNSVRCSDPTSLSEIAETDWGARIFSATPVSDIVITLWEWICPLKGRPLAVEGDLSAEGMRFAVVVARWNAVITDRLLQGALDALFRSGASRSNVEILRVPGAWEIPSAARKLAEGGKFDAIVTLGLLLRGETAHYEAIYTEVSRGIGQSQQETGIPHSFGVLTCETLEQALDRAGLKAGNKGFEAAFAAIEMVSLHRKIAQLNQ
jgi:6,7-dimethyl-8-ribityllumazine synthase